MKRVTSHQLRRTQKIYLNQKILFMKKLRYHLLLTDHKNML
jgi:hypothetical protein